MTFTISAPPHRKSGKPVKNVMWAKALALVPVSLVSIYFFGVPALGILVAGVLSALATEFVIQKAFNQKLTVADGHVVFIGLLLSLLIPPEAPIWIPIIGSAFAVSIGKHAFGGIGSYVFNPVLVAWVFLTLAWTSLMTPVSVPQLGALSNLLIENGAGFLVGVSPIALLTGALLIATRYMEWRVPVAYFFTTILLALILGDSLSFVITGVFLLGVLFIATDSATSPVTKSGRVIYGVLCGVLTVVYGYFGDYVYGTLYGIFLANCVASFIDNSTLPKPYGSETRMQRIMKRVPFLDRFLEV